jgi:hypothetical protein
MPENQWLFPDNIQFANGAIAEPVNKGEILQNLKQKYQVYDVPIVVRIPVGLLLLVTSMLLIYFVLGLLQRVLLLPLDVLTKLHHTLLGIFAAFVALACLIFAQRFLLPRHGKVQSDWQRLKNSKIILSGRITATEALSLMSKKFEYEFLNEQGKTIIGEYYHDYIRDSPTNVEGMFEWLEYNKKSDGQSVMIWYATDDIHCLL